jgi:hypothetical protein
MSALGRLSLWCLRNARTPEQIVKGMARWIGLVREVRRAPNGVAALALIWRYILAVGDRFGPDDLVVRLLAAVGDDEKEEIVNVTQQFVELGRSEGIKEGVQKGQQTLLLKQLQIRFGPLPEAAVARVNAAGTAELELWAERIFTAPTLDDVLGPPELAGPARSRSPAPQAPRPSPAPLYPAVASSSCPHIAFSANVLAFSGTVWQKLALLPGSAIRCARASSRCMATVIASRAAS